MPNDEMVPAPVSGTCPRGHSQSDIGYGLPGTKCMVWAPCNTCGKTVYMVGTAAK